MPQRSSERASEAWRRGAQSACSTLPLLMRDSGVWTLTAHLKHARSGCTVAQRPPHVMVAVGNHLHQHRQLRQQNLQKAEREPVAIQLPAVSLHGPGCRRGGCSPIAAWATAERNSGHDQPLSTETEDRGSMARRSVPVGTRAGHWRPRGGL